MSSSASSSPSSSRSSSPEPVARKPNDKGKQKEAGIANWALEPPSGAVAIDDASVNVGEFDWDAVNADPDNEVWLIRVPEGVKPKHLEASVLSSSSLAKTSRTGKVGSLSRKHTTYDVWSLADVDDAENADPEGAAATPVGGEELRALSCLLPRRKKRGDLYLAPKPVARHLVFSARELQPAPPQSAIPLQNPPRQSYPEEMLTHKFMPYGSLVAAADEDGDIAMDAPVAEAEAPPVEESTHMKKDKKDKKVKKEKKTKEETATTTKAQKRKGDAEDDGPKKSKKKKVS